MGLYTKASIKGHAIHPILIAFPITFYTLAPVCFAVFEWVRHTPFWFELAEFSVYAGIVTSLVAAIPGTIDWAFGIPKNTAAHKRGLLHMILNVLALILFIAAAAVLRGYEGQLPDSVLTCFVLTGIGLCLTGVSGWHGGELIITHKVGVRMNAQQMVYENTKAMKPEWHE